MLKIKGKVIEVENKLNILTTVVHGIKKGKPEPFGATAGSNGTYRIGYPETSHSLLITVNIFNIKTCNYQKIYIDVRKLLLDTNGWTKVTKQRVNQLKEKLLNQFVDIENNKGEWHLVDEKTMVNIVKPIRIPQYSEIFAPPEQFNTVIDYLKFRFKSCREYRDFLLSQCRIGDFKKQKEIYESFPYKEEYLDKPIGTKATDQDYKDAL